MTRFTTKLHNSIHLDGSYEVSLVEILYPISWKYRPGGFIRITIENEISISLKVEFFVYESIPDLIFRINEDFKLMRITPLIDFLAKTQKIYLFVPEDVTLNFENDMHKTFGFLERQYKGLKKQPNGKRVVFKSEGTLNNYLNEINIFYVYSDIVEYQVVGDVNAPLLRLVASNQTNGLKFMSKVFDSPHYLPVSRNNM